ncbi:MAG: long-chain fatty acid--CoA ligase [Deltaproteobacteria bacterium]|nr:long-chain fatty acid--CoA ligase [Deltaproteobacteria bacterium]
MEFKTIVAMFLENAERFRGDTLIKYKKKRGGPYLDLTWGQLQDLSIACAFGMINLGLERGDRVAILSFNRLEWIVTDLGIMIAGGVDVPIYHTNTADQAAYIIKDSGAKFAVVEDTAQLEKVLSVAAELEGLRRIILMEGVAPEDDERIIPFSALVELGQVQGAELKDELEERLRRIGLDDLATIVYTSGTTGPPKGCMISHQNIAFVLWSIHELIRIDPERNLSLMILPLSHLYPRVSGYYYNLSINIPFAIAESIETIGQNMTEVRPTYFTGVPRIFEKVHDRIVSTAERGSVLKRAIFRWSVRVGRERSRRLIAWQPIPLMLKLKHAVADRLVFKKIRDMLGGRLWSAVSAGAPLSREVGEFIHSLGIQVIEFYGLTETICGTMTTFDELRYGTVGKPMPGVEVQLAPDGEILIRGNNFMGYYNRPDLTEQTLCDGWLYTGDVGKWDEHGFLVITDRKKDLIITSGGKNVAPQNIENLLKRIPLVSIPMVYGDNKKFLTAVVTLDRAETEVFAKEKGMTYSTYDELTQSLEIRRHIQQGIDRVNAQLAKYESIKSFLILPREFSQEQGEITPTLKLKRKAIIAKYGGLLEKLYEQAG